MIALAHFTVGHCVRRFVFDNFHVQLQQYCFIYFPRLGTRQASTVTLRAGGQPHATSTQTRETNRKQLNDGPHFREISRRSSRVENMLVSLVSRAQAFAGTRRESSSILRAGRQFHVSPASYMLWTRYWNPGGEDQSHCVEGIQANGRLATD